MESCYEETPLVAVKDSPVPPPLPAPPTTSYHKNGFRITRSAPRGRCCVSKSMQGSWDRLFDEAYRADVLISTKTDEIIYAHACVLGIASPVFKAMLNKPRSSSSGPHSISIHGVPHEAVRIFIRFLYSSCYEQEEMEEHIMPLLALSHAYAVPQLKQLCECQLENGLLTPENVVDVFQLSMLCDAPRLSLLCHRFILNSFKATSATEGWTAMKASHPILEKELLESMIDEDNIHKEKIRKSNEKKIYLQLYEAMDALEHICRDGCRTIGPHDKVLKEDKEPCHYEACKGLELLIRHFAGCKMRVTGGCIHCKRMWQLLELHSRLCADSNVCKVPLCRNFKHKRKNQKKKDEIKWRILVRKIVRTKSITGAPYFSLASS